MGKSLQQSGLALLGVGAALGVGERRREEQRRGGAALHRRMTLGEEGRWRVKAKAVGLMK